MNHKMRPQISRSMKNSSMSDQSRNLHPEQPFIRFDSGTGRFPEFGMATENQSFGGYGPGRQSKRPALEEAAPILGSSSVGWDPQAVLSNLSFLEQKIHQLQDVVRGIVARESQFPVQTDKAAAQQQAVNDDLTSIVIQLISTVGCLLPSAKNTLTSVGSLLPSAKNTLTSVTPAAQIPNRLGSSGDSYQNMEGSSSEASKGIDYEELLKGFSDCTGEGPENMPVEDHEVKESEDGMDGEHLPPGSYEILQLEKEEILAPHTHFCGICGKGFKRDANLRMHMRGHGDEYKTAAALAKPAKEASSEPMIIKRYSCPFSGCKRNKAHKKFQPLKTILCVKNHYKRSHCDKSYMCSRCKCKKFSVLADLKTHEKHCGRDKWLCSCGTTFSRKDKLFGHVALFQGHTPAIPIEELAAYDQSQFTGTVSEMETMGYGYTGDALEPGTLDIKGIDVDRSYFLPINYDSCNFGVLDDFPRPAFDFSENSFSFGSGNFARRDGEGSS